jgi:ribosomal protein S12 methylthiotransferase
LHEEIMSKRSKKDTPLPPRVGILSLGCAKNLVDSEHIASLLEEAGVEVTTEITSAPVVIVNSCGFIDIAKEESIDAVLEVADLKQEGELEKLIVTGCLTQRYGEELRELLPEADVMVGIDPHATARAALWELGLGDTMPSQCNLRVHRFTPRSWAYLRISEGCDNCCAYCAIPSIRGRLVSRPMDEILSEAEDLISSGALELNVIAQDTTSYGRDHGTARLHELLARLAELEHDGWLRLLYTHPAHYYPELIEVLATEEVLCPYLDIPLQHIADPVLERMGRGIRRAEIEELVANLRHRIPDLTLRTTFMVGFPGETDEDFQELLDFVREVRFERLGAFRYSSEEDTRAYDFEEEVPEEVREERYHALMELQREIAFEVAAERIGERKEVLVEEEQDEGPENQAIGRSHAEAPDVDPIIFIEDAGDLRRGDMVEVEITDSFEYDCIARPTGPREESSHD